jgi:hypothetical protein
MFKQVKYILPDLLVKHGFKEQAKTIHTVQLFDEYITKNCKESIARNCRGMYVQNGCFYIGVTANAAAQEIQMQKEALLAYMNANLTNFTLHDIRCKIVHE